MSFISTAYASAGQPAAGGGMDAILANVFPFALIFVVFYFMLIRPQQKKAKEHREMLAALRKGDAVITAGGMYGRIIEILDGDLMVVDLGETKVTMGRAYLSAAPGSKRAAPPPAKKEKKSKRAAKEETVVAAEAAPSADSQAEATAVESAPVAASSDDKDKPAA